MDTSMNIKDFILDVYRESELWNYYSDNTITKQDICKTNDCRVFIEFFFGASGKEDCMSSLIKDLKDLSDERCQHIVYVFLLGVGIYHKEEKLKERIDSQIDNYRKKYGRKSDVNFLFVWFLCCLFHDLGYVKEESDDINWDFNLNEIGSSVGIPKFYRGTTKKYLKYIKDKYKKIDHGIYSGITMFKSLCEIRHNKEIQNKIMWEKELIPIYNISSWVVLCHNIWLQEKETIDAIENCKTPDAYNSLAIRYVLGKGVPANKKKAFELFDKAGYASYARFNIASLIACGYFEGTVDDVEDYLRMSNDGGMAVNGWVVDGEDKFNLIRENAKKYTRQSDLYLFFDTETTGTPFNYKAPSSDTRNWPRLVQLGWILMTEKGKKVSEKNYIVKPNGFTIPAEATKIHNITTKMALEQGQELSFVIDEFLQDFNKAKYVVGHNIDFDKKIVGAELIRLSRPDIMNSKEAFCTMKSSTDFCKIPGYYGYKYPKLQELYHKLFGRDFEDAHDAANDIEATQQCFWELRKKGLI